MEFLSVRNLEIHKEYYNDLKLKYSVFEKSYVELKGKSLNDIPRCRIRSEERKKAFLLRAEIDAHELFFSSFKNRNTVCPQINKEWGSLQNFLYTIFQAKHR